MLRKAKKTGVRIFVIQWVNQEKKQGSFSIKQNQNKKQNFEVNCVCTIIKKSLKGDKEIKKKRSYLNILLNFEVIFYDLFIAFAPVKGFL